MSDKEGHPGKDEPTSIYWANTPAPNTGYSVTDITGSLRVVNDLSANLKWAVPDPSFLRAYGNILDTQARTLVDTLALGEQLNLKASGTAMLVSSAVAPLSSVIAEAGLISTRISELVAKGNIGFELSEAGRISKELLDSIAGQQSIITENLKLSNRLGFSDMLAVYTPTRIVGSGLGEMLGSLPSYSEEKSSPELKIVEEVGRITEKELSDYQERLDLMLAKVDPELVAFRKGSWHAFKERGPDYLGQASSSMRRLIDNLLRALAPDDKVVETDYFQNSKVDGNGGKDSKGNPTRKARILFILKFETNRNEHLERLTDGFLKTYGNLSAWDHAPLNKEQFVEGAFIAIEGHLLSILSENQT